MLWRMVYAGDVAKPGPQAYEDETGDRSEKRLPLIPVTPGEYEAIMSGAKLAGAPSYADWAREILARAAKKAGVDLPKKKPRKKSG